MDTERTPLIILDSYQTFGKNTFWLFLSSWLSMPIGFLIVSFIVSLVRRSSLVPLEYQKMVAVGGLILLGVGLLSGIISFLVARFAYKRQGFCVSSNAFQIREGVFTKQETAIPYRQIQNVSIERTFIQQMCGVSRIVIVTAGQDDVATEQNESKAILETIDKDLATALQSELLKRANIEKVINVTK